jgi:serine/threonine protein kinase
MDAPKKIGRYEILQEIGRGAMGTVYRGKDPAMNRVVAIKTIISAALAGERGAEFREHFYHEARAAGALLHPGIVAVFDVGEHEGTPYLVMEFINGRTLADTMEKGKPLNPERVCDIGEKVAEALGYAHRHGVIHRDIKPDNILLPSRGAHGALQPTQQAKISDFGVAKLAEPHATLSGEIRGTPAFMSPEQFSGASIDGRADLFSLGVVLYLMATGEHPFPGKNMTDVFYKIVHEDPVAPRKLNPDLPAKLESVVLKCLAKDPAERYQSGRELACELGELRAAIDASAPEVSEPRAGPFGAARRHAQASAAWPSKENIGLVLAAVTVATMVALGLYFLPNRKKSTAQEMAAPVTASPPASSNVQVPLPKQVAVAGQPSPSASIAKAVPAKTPIGANRAAKTSGVRATTPASPAAAPSPKTAMSDSAPAAVDFDPKTLDPKQNARLRIDTEQMPPGLSFAVEMNGKIFLQHAPGRDVQAQDLFVPPGVQEFRVVAKSATVQKNSNTVSKDFMARKRNTLKIELRTQGISQGVPQGLYPDTQVVLTLK